MALIEAELFKAFSRLRDKLKLVPGILSPVPKFSTIIIPVTNVDDLLKTPHLKETASLSVTGTGVTWAFTVPAGKRWSLIALRVVRDAGVFTFSQIRLKSATVTPMAIDVFTSAAERILTFSQPIPLDEAWQIGVYVDSYTSAGSFFAVALFQEEDAY